MNKFKVGDKVKPTASGFQKLCSSCAAFNGGSSDNPEYLILNRTSYELDSSKFSWNAYRSDGTIRDRCSGHNLQDEDLELYDSPTVAPSHSDQASAPAVVTITQPNNKTMNVIKTVKDMALKVSNPAEFFRRKAGLHDLCGELTSDGKELVWQYLKEQFADRLATDAEVIVDEQSKNE